MTVATRLTQASTGARSQFLLRSTIQFFSDGAFELLILTSTLPPGSLLQQLGSWKPPLFFIHQRTTAKLPLVNISRTQSAMAFNML